MYFCVYHLYIQVKAMGKCTKFLTVTISPMVELEMFYFYSFLTY